MGEKPSPRGFWAREQAERHLGRTLEASDLPLEGWLSNPENPELWVFRGMPDPRRKVTVTYAVEADAAFVSYVTGPGAGVFEKWVDGVKVSERVQPAGETIGIPWEDEEDSDVSP